MTSKAPPNPQDNTKTQGMLLPNIPKLTDDKSRVKYMTDYEKYEGELHKHHLGPATNTVGLRSLNADFDRRVPSLDEPMDVDRLYGQQKKKNTTTRGGSGKTNSRSITPVPLATAAAETKSATRTSVAPLSGEAEPVKEKSAPVQNSGNSSTVEDAKPAAAPQSNPSKKANSVTKEGKRQSARSAPPVKDTTPATLGSAMVRTAGRTTKPAATGRSSSETPVPTHSFKPASTAPISDPLDPRLKFTEAARNTALPRGDTETKAPLLGTSGSNDVEGCAELLRLLVTPPYEYADSFLLEMEGIDLSWLAGKRPRPAVLTSIEQLSPTGGTVPTLYSPRSALVCLRNGVSMADLKPSVSEDQLPNEKNLREAVSVFRSERDAKRRSRLLGMLRADYRELCAKVDVERLIEAFHHPPPPKALSDPPTALLQRQERQRKVFETNKVRMEKQVEYAKETQARRLEAEERLRQAEEEAQLALEEKKRKEMEAKALQEERLERQKQKNKEMEEFYQQQLDTRIALAEERSKQREEAQERLMEQRRLNREAKEEERLRRLERNAEVQKAQAEAAEEKRREKEEKLERLTQERQDRIAAEHAEMLVRQEKAARAREEARRRADEEEQRVREVALARQREVEKRLEEFERERQEKRLTRAREEEEKEQRRELARLKEEQKEEEFKAKVIRTQQEHEAAYAEAQKERELELALRKEKEREEIEEKLYAVRKKKRVDEFCKLRTTADLFEKRKAADAVEEQRNLIYEKMMTERKLLNEERDQLKKTISEQQQIC